MTENEGHPPNKKGLYGWRAVVAMVGCGTLAAVFVMGGIYGILNLFSSTLGTPVESPGSNGGGSGRQEPKDELPQNDLDLCENIPDLLDRSYDTQRVEEPSSYSDSVNSSGQRVVSDDCQWDIENPKDATDSWSLSLSYESFVPEKGDEAPVETAERRYQELVGNLPENFADADHEGETEEFGDEAIYSYGTASDDEDSDRFVLLSRTKSSVYEISLEGNRDGATWGQPSISSSSFSEVARSMTTEIDWDLRNRVPG